MQSDAELFEVPRRGGGRGRGRHYLIKLLMPRTKIYIEIRESPFRSFVVLLLSLPLYFLFVKQKLISGSVDNRASHAGAALAGAV